MHPKTYYKVFIVSYHKENHRLMATGIDCASYSTIGNWSYIIYDVDYKCYDSNPDKTLYS